MSREWSMSRTAPSTIAPASPWRLPMLAETPPMLEMPATPCTTSTSPSSARLCASMSARPETLRVSSALRLSTVIACPTTRAPGSVGFRSDAGTVPAMPHSSSASDVVPVRSPSLRKPARMLASRRGSSVMPIAVGFSFPSGVFAIESPGAIMAEPSPSFNPKPRTPRLKLPRGACDTHFHVFGPQQRFPFAPERSYTPTCDAPKETLFAMHKQMGIERGVVVQSAAHGFDNSAAADLLSANKNYRGVALAPASTATVELKQLDKLGFRGVRFHYMEHLGKGDRIEDVLVMATRLAAIGWHLQIHMDGSRIAELTPALRRSPVPVVIDHMGRVDASNGPEHADFRALLILLNEKHI